MNKSPFIDKEKIHENKFAFAIYDGFSVSKGHSVDFELIEPLNQKLKQEFLRL